MSNRQRVKLSTICDIYDGTHQTPKYVDSGVKFLSVENINNIADSNKFISEEDYNRDFKVRPERNDILMTRIGDIGTPAIVNDDSAYAYYVSLALLKCKQDRVYPQWLKQAITTNDFQHQLWLKTLHVAFPKKINKGEIGECLISLPSLEEQQYTAKVLNVVDEVISEREEEVKDLEKQKKGLMQKIFSQELRFTDSNNNPYPNWEEKKIKDIGYISMCKRIFREQTSTKGDIPFYKIGTFGKEPDAFISRELFQEYKEKYPYPKTGNILISASGTIGRTVEYNGEDAYYQDSNIIWINHNDLIMDKFLNVIIQNTNWDKVIEGSTIKRLYNNNLLELKISLPCLEEQQKIANILSKLDELIEEKKALLSDWQQFKKGLLQQMFV